MVELDGGRVLRAVRMLCSGVHLELLNHLTSERTLGQHAAH